VFKLENPTLVSTGGADTANIVYIKLCSHFIFYYAPGA